VIEGTPTWARGAAYYAIVLDRFARSGGWPGTLDASALAPWEAGPDVRGYRGGDLDGAASRLDHVASLGVDAVLLSPVWPSPAYHRYKPVELFTVDPLLGGDAAFDRFVAAARARGLRVVLDAVLNHVGSGFRGFQDVLTYGDRSPWRRWFVREGDGFHGWNGNASMPVLNHREPAVRRFAADVLEFWLRRGVSGFRLDAAGEIAVPELWAELRARARATDPEALIVGEAWPPAPDRVGPAGWDGATHYPWHGAVTSFVLGAWGAERFAEELGRLHALYPWENTLATWTFLSTHDTARFLTVAGGDRGAFDLGVALLATLPGAPVLYYGDEVGMAGGPPPASRAGFAGEERWDRERLENVRRWMTARRSHPALREGGFAVVEARGTRLAFVRGDGPTACRIIVDAGLRSAYMDAGGSS
jgi:cyclomaltodextrinase/neopullulanase